MIEVFDKEKVIAYLKYEDEISNLNMIGAINNITDGITGDSKDRLRMYVDDENSPNGVIVQEHEYWFYVYAKNTEFIHHIKNNFFSLIKEYGFDASDKEVYDILLDNKIMDWDEVCTLLYIDPDDYVAYENKIIISKGTVEDASMINDLYTYKEEGSLEFIEDNLKNRPSAVYRINGEAVAWLLLHRDNSMGIMYTKENYRGQNIAYELSMNVIDQVIKNGDKPFIHIGLWNKASYKLAAKCGFKSYKEIYWFGIK